MSVSAPSRLIDEARQRAPPPADLRGVRGARGADWQLYVMNADGSGQQRLTTQPGENGQRENGQRLACLVARQK